MDKSRMAAALVEELLRSASKKKFADSLKPPAVEVEVEGEEAPEAEGNDEADMAELEALVAAKPEAKDDEEPLRLKKAR